MPQQYSTISRARCNVTIRCNIAFRARQACYHIKMAKHNLNDFSNVGDIDAETVIPEAAGNQKSTIHCGHEAIGTDFQFLTEIIAQMSTDRWITVSIGLN